MGSNNGHGDHWECIYHSAVNFLETLPDLLQKSILFDRTPWHFINGLADGVESEEIAALVDEGPGIKHLLLIAAPKGQGSAQFITGYPFAESGAKIRVEVLEIVTWEDFPEGQIIAELENPPHALIGFFDTMFFKNHCRYVAGNSYTFTLSALAYNVQPVPEFIAVDKTENNCLMWEGKPPEEPLRVYMSEAVGLLPVSSQPDEFSFLGKVRSIDAASFAGSTLLLMNVAVLRDDDRNEIVIPLIVAEHNLEPGYMPKVGDTISGGLWLQGYLDTSLI